MNAIVQPERATQDRVVALFRDELGYRHLGDWTDRTGNSHIEAGLLTDNLTEAGYPRPRSAERCRSDSAVRSMQTGNFSYP